MTFHQLDERKTSMLHTLRGRLIVSCQAYPGEPLRDPDAMARIAQSAVIGGAAAIRAQGLGDIRAIARSVTVPQIGLWKVGAEGVFITPTLDHAVAVAGAGAHIVAIDGTRRERPDGLSLAQTIRELKRRADVLVMADAGSADDGLAAEDAGADIVGTTLAGYTGERPRTTGPDLELVNTLAARLSVPLFAEGRIHTPNDARAALAAGAYSVVVGTAITHPASITSWYVEALAEERTVLAESHRQD
ncbi:N-acetylmannosamine-6-phosphate 2-epimerase [Microbacterium sp. zg.Y1084]|uniref:N-acetylmannosamine-6-phosphate 2-epimerase n=1 Tax=Microbacterium sp. zg.Y1084 TaxID=2969667 RepID=UPI00214CE5E2|nr:N-acetylmannosamine-6-phosphate 2-epimerase [Microbacterium sp. zg.Y1084]MCR2813900.1 N-acetylmannosamine-6-phosphate 2-epimerase [Microbacterium sp. zg.Y1084]